MLCNSDTVTDSVPDCQPDYPPDPEPNCCADCSADGRADYIADQGLPAWKVQAPLPAPVAELPEHVHWGAGVP